VQATKITINGCDFYATKAAATESLFTGPKTAHGTFKADATGIRLYNMRGERIGGINRYGVLYRSTRIDGRFWHQCANPDGIPEYARYSRGREEARELLQSVGLQAY